MKPPTRHAPRILLALLSFLILPMLSGSAYAQNTGKITGTVRDSSGKPIPYVNVILTNIGEGVIADEAGKYTFENVPPGTYVVVFRHISVETRQIDGVAVRQPSRPPRREPRRA